MLVVFFEAGPMPGLHLLPYGRQAAAAASMPAVRAVHLSLRVFDCPLTPHVTMQAMHSSCPAFSTTGKPPAPVHLRT